MGEHYRHTGTLAWLQTFIVVPVCLICPSVWIYVKSPPLSVTPSLSLRDSLSSSFLLASDHRRGLALRAVQTQGTTIRREGCYIPSGRAANSTEDTSTHISDLEAISAPHPPLGGYIIPFRAHPTLAQPPVGDSVNVNDRSRTFIWHESLPGTSWPSDRLPLSHFLFLVSCDYASFPFSSCPSPTCLHTLFFLGFLCAALPVSAPFFIFFLLLCKSLAGLFL